MIDFEDKATAIVAARTQSPRCCALDMALADAQSREDIAQALADLDAKWARRLEQRQRDIARWLRKVRKRRAARRRRAFLAVAIARLERRVFRDAGKPFLFGEPVEDPAWEAAWGAVEPAAPAEGTEA